MKTSTTLILLRQHRSLCLVSARLPGWIASPRLFISLSFGRPDLGRTL